MGAEFADQCERYFGSKATSIVGAAGSMFLVNTLALHRGLMPTKKPRLVIWARYGLDPPASLALPVKSARAFSKLADTPRNRYVNRLLFEFDNE